MGAPVAEVNSALKWYLNQENNPPEHVSRVTAIQTRIPKISREPEKPRLALSDLSESLKYDDTTLIKSLREFCVVMLKIMGEQREYLLSVPEIINAQSKLSNLNEVQQDLVQRGLVTSPTLTSEITQTYIKPIWDAIAASDDVVLIERLLLNCSYTRSYIQNREDPMTLEEQKKLLELHLTNNGLLRTSISAYYTKNKRKGKVVSAAKFTQLSYESFSKPTKVEEVLISWLLASERIQPSGQFELTLEDYYITGGTGSWDFSKNRSIAKDHSSRLYGINSLIHKTYLEYIKLCKSSHSHKFAVGKNIQPAQMRLTFRQGTDYDPLLSAALKGSHLRNRLVNAHPITKPFIDLLTKVCEHNNSIYDSYGKSNKGMINLALSFVAQSVAITSTRRKVRGKQNSYEMYGQGIVDAALDGHTPATKYNIYINRSETVTRINERKWFSEIVSEEMVTDALNLKAALSKSDTRIMSLSEARKILGLKGIKADSNGMSELGDFLNECEEANYKTGQFGDVTLDSKKIIVETPTTAALMLSYQSELKKELQKNQYGSNRKSAYMLYRYLYVDEILNTFAPSTIEQGKQLLERFDIPSPPIFVDNL
ncbi:TPA: hypothetical protein NJ594_001813 [Vibrio parahaemolyticus]|nr:hypothetical protein [Vibrio parahaemolyticus]